MRYKKLGSTGLDVSVIGLGTWAMGGRWWGPTDDETAVAAINQAFSLGINLIDTADIYGFGHSESLLGEVLGSRRKNVILATKVGLRWNNKGKVRHDLSPEHIAMAIDASLKRLKTDYVDIYQVHWPDPEVPIEATAEALLECVESGKVRFLGFSNHAPKLMNEFRKHGQFDVCQPPLNLFERHAEVGVLPYCYKKNVGVLVYSPLCRGLLSGGFKVGQEFNESLRRNDPFFNGKVFERNLAVVAKLKEFAEEHNRTVSQLALAWILAHSGVTTALCGARKPEHFSENVGAADWKLSYAQLEQIEKILITSQI